MSSTPTTPPLRLEENEEEDEEEEEEEGGDYTAPINYVTGTTFDSKPWQYAKREDDVPKANPRRNKKKILTFSESMKEVVKAVSQSKPIRGVDLIKLMRESEFRFYTTEPEGLSLDLSQAFTHIADEIRSISASEVAKKSAEKRNENADKFAEKMYTIIEELKKETGVTTVRGTVDLLNSRGIETYSGAKWHGSTLQNLQKRWKELGLD